MGEMGHSPHFGNMALVTCLLALALLTSILAVPGNRIRRGYNSGYGDSSSGYGRGSDERDASVSEENSGGCNNGGSGYGGGRGYGYSSSQERAYNRDGWKDTRGGRSLTRSSASAVASASAYALKQKANIVK